MGDVEAHGGCCLESMGQTTERWVYKGPGLGSYSKVGSLQLVGYGKGSFEILGFEGSLESSFLKKKTVRKKWAIENMDFFPVHNSQSNLR